jgi:dTMP kinase
MFLSFEVMCDTMSTFIVLDGIDGSGKGEQLKRLHNFLFEKDKRNVILTTREPTYGIYGAKIRKILKQDTNPYEKSDLLLELYTKDREEHLKEIVNPFLFNESGEIRKYVLCDRYYYSTYAFQNAQGVPFEKIREMQKNFLKPTVAFILDLPPEVAFERINKNRESKEKFEELEFMKKLRENFLALKNKLDDNIIIIDASKSKEDVFNQILEHLKKLNLI